MIITKFNVAAGLVLCGWVTFANAEDYVPYYSVTELHSYTRWRHVGLVRGCCHDGYSRIQPL